MLHDGVQFSNVVNTEGGEIEEAIAQDIRHFSLMNLTESPQKSK